MADPFAEAVDAIFAGDLAVTETFTPKGGAPVSVRVAFERGVVTERPGMSARVVERTTRAHLRVSEVGTPARDSTITDTAMGVTRVVDSVDEQDEYVVVVKVR